MNNVLKTLNGLISPENSNSASLPSTGMGAKETVKKDDPPIVHEHGGPKGLEPTRYGDWEKNGKCVDF